MEGEGMIKRRLMGAIVGAVLLVGMLAAPASAHGQPWQWNQGEAVGYCGLTNGGYVKSFQAILWASGQFSSMSAVDGIFGSATNSATKSWQLSHNLNNDGCAGVYTWDKAQNGSHWNSQFQFTDYHMAYLSTVCDGQTGLCEERYEWREGLGSRWVKYGWRTDAPKCCGAWGWMLKQLINDSNGNQQWIDQPVWH